MVQRGRIRSSRGGGRLSLRLALVLLLSLSVASCGSEGGGEPATRGPATGAPGGAGETSNAGADEMTARSGDQEIDARLISAAGRGDVEEIESLLDEGASVRSRDESGRTALAAAAYGNHLDAAGALVGAGADVNAKDDTEQSAYLISTSEVGDDPRLLELMLENGADVRSLDSYDGTGLIRSADRGHVRIVGKLLETRTDIDHVNNLGWTALLEAVILGGGDERHAEVVRLLVEGGADPNIPDGEGVTPLQHARANGYDEMAAILEGAGRR